MPRRVFAIAIAIILTISAVAASKGNRQVQARKIANPNVQSIRSRPILSAADTCVANNNGEIAWLIDGWVIGNEVYKQYINPADSCGAPYPFEILGVGIIMHFGKPVSIQFSSDIELADFTNPSCPFPGTLLDISDTLEFTIAVADTGYWDIFVPLNSPITVTEPFFAGIFIANIIDSSDHVGLITDADSLTCWSYNMWDENGFIDLVDNEFFNFPGRLIMYAAGVPGGSGGNQPPPAVRFVSHRNDARITGETVLWAQDTSGSEIIDYVSFSYYKVGDPPIEIGADYDGFSPLRNDLDAASPGDGYSITWDPSGLEAGFYTMSVTAFDTLGRSSTDVIKRVKIEPTRPTPNIVFPANGSNFCNTFDFIISAGSNDLTSVLYLEQPALLTYSLGLTGVPAPTVPEAAPAAAAAAIKHWDDNGYPDLMTDVNSLVSDLTVLFRTDQNSGTFDEDLFAGLYNYQFGHGSDFAVEYMRNPSYFDVRIWAESEQRAVLLGIGGSRGTWLAVDGFKSWPQGNDPFFISVMLPTTGTVLDLPIQNTLNTSQIELYGVWERIDIMVSLVPTAHTVNRDQVGLNFDGSNNWGISFIPDSLSLSEDNLYFYRAEGANSSTTAASTVLLNYNCSATFLLGDFNSDGTRNLADYNILQDFIAFNGAPPPGGGHRADTNCDQTVNLADLVFYINFLFGTAGPPCW